MAKKPPVICPYCKQKFYREESDYIQLPNKRYAHTACYENNRTIKEEIHQKMQEVCGDLYNRKKIDFQIKDLLDRGRTESGILQAINYWYDIKKGDPKRSAGGIGIVDYIYDEAQKYYESSKKRQQQAEYIYDFRPPKEKVIIHPKPITKPKRVKMFDL